MSKIRLLASVLILADVEPDSLNLNLGVSVVSISSIAISAFAARTTKVLSAEKSDPIPKFPALVNFPKIESFGLNTIP